MPESITLQDGTTREVPTAEEQAALQKAATDGKAAAEKLMEIDGDPNWQKVRPQIEFAKNARKALEEKGFKLNDKGEILESPAAVPGEKPLTAEEIKKLAEDAARSVATGHTFDQKKDARFAHLDADTRSVAELMYSKLTAGETLTPENQEKLLTAALGAAMPGKLMTTSVVRGAPPRQPAEGSTYADSEEGRKVAEAMFGKESFTNKKP